jgi:ribosome-binding ATPase YchF (GTP1/OBG family)
MLAERGGAVKSEMLMMGAVRPSSDQGALDETAEGSFAKAKDAGHWRLEGKNYVVRDGDIMNIRHS